MCKMVSSKPWRGNLEIDKLEALVVELKLVSWSCRSVHGWMSAAVKQSSERDVKNFLVTWISTLGVLGWSG